VLENVELALTLSGIKKTERRTRAIQVLNQVGLGDKLKAKPNQLSGGQMQRVAIARALVNDPEIILADEPTGALDSKTSVQIMEILKEISKDRLVIMVTHNPELAEDYSTRIIRLLDGELKEDTNNYTHKESEKEINKHKKQTETKQLEFKKTENKKSMSFLTALFLSFKNLLTKKGRTIMVAFAGSIGIIGIALILAVSAGMTGYINRMQSESLSSYPISVSTVAVDMNGAMETLAGEANKEQEKPKDSIIVNNPQDTLLKMGKFNYLSKDFVEYVNDYYSDEQKGKLLNEYKVSYASDMRLITKNGPIYMPINNAVTTSVLSGTTSAQFFEGFNNKDYVLSMYDMLGGEHAHYPQQKNEVALVLNSDTMSFYDLASYGISTPKDTDGTYLPIKYEDIVNIKTYKLLYHDAYYNATTEQPKVNFSLLSTTEGTESFYKTYTQEDLMSLYNHEKTLELKITCILKLKESASGSLFSNGIMYTSALAKDYHTNCKQSEVVQTVKSKYLNEQNQLINGNENFVNKYFVRISELQTYFGLDNGIFAYDNPNAMKQTLKEHFNLELTDEELIDLYLQYYGASEIPTNVYFYPKSFAGKDDLTNMLATWNKQNETNKIYHNDTTTLITNILGGIVDIISYVLIAFAGISLVVSSIMISIITYTSVIERTKEIGVLRSVGASKRDVSRVFNAETTIIGFLAGVFGVGIAYLLTIPIGLLLKALTGVAGLATLNPIPAVVLIVISVVLTFVAGLVPASIASKKDPVLALRSE